MGIEVVTGVATPRPVELTLAEPIEGEFEMLKIAFIAGALTLAGPAFAQEVPAGQKTQPVPTTTVPTAPAQPTDASPAAPSPGESVQGTPAVTSSVPAPDAAATPAQATAAAPATTGNQVADAVTTGFPTYDRNGDGALSSVEFGAWMVALKTESDPATKASAPATRTWVTQAFAQADKDKNRKVSKTELTGFLSKT